MASRKRRKRSKQVRTQLPKIPKTANELFLDAMVRHQIGLMRVAKGIGKQVNTLLDASERDLRNQIRRRLRKLKKQGLSTSAGVRSMRALMKEIRKTRGKSHAEVARLFDREMKALAVAEAQFMAMATEAVLPVLIDTTLPSPSLLRSIVNTRPFQGRTLKGWAKSIKIADLDRIESQIKIGLTQGESIPEISRRIVGSAKLRGRDGVTAITRRNAEAIARTSVNAITNQAKQEFYKANADIVKWEVYVATLDGVTTAICRSLDEKKFRVGEGDVPPLHINCRSLRVAVFDDDVLSTRPMKPVTERGLLREFTKNEKLDSVTKRANLPHGTKGRFDKFARKRTRELIGQVPDKTSYQQWLGTQPKSFRVDVLGKTKERLFTRGRLKLDKFVNRQGDEFTLSQLARSDASAFRAAGLDPKDFL